MKVVKPQYLSILTRCYEFRREARLGIAALAFVPMSLTERRLIPELAMWPAVSEQLDGSPMLEAGIPKRKSEYLVVGAAHPPGGRPVRECTVMAEIAGRRKALLVRGDREWRSAIAASEPLPFTQMPLAWARAFGGPEYARNPLGRGFQPDSGLSARLRALPNIEYAHALVQAPADRPEPAGFGPIDITWPQRASLAGTHDQGWLHNDFPGFPRDMDWELFNVAPADQRFETPFALDAPYVLHNMHPRHPRLSGCLPSVRARCFVQRSSREAADAAALEEASLTLRTLWLFPEIERIVMIFQGEVAVAEDDASDVTHLLAAVESVGEERSLEYYRDVLKRRCDRRTAHLYALKDGELCPAELMAPDPRAQSAQQAATAEDLGRHRLNRRIQRELEAARQRVAALGLDPDLHAPAPALAEAPGPSLEELPEYLAQLERDAQREQERAREDQATRDAELERLFAQLGLDFETVRRERAQSPVGPPSFTVEGKVAELQRLIGILAAQGFPTDHVQEILDDPKMRKVWEHGELQSREAYRATAHLQNAAPSGEAERTGAIREQVRERLASGGRLAGFDFTGADLSAMQLDGADLEGAFMESVSLRSSSLRGANLKHAVLAHADATECDFGGADLQGCNLGASRCVSADFSGAQLPGAILANADLSTARFDGAELENTDLTGATLVGASFAEAKAKQITISQASMRGVRFERAVLNGCNLLNVDLDGASFRAADLSGTLFLACKGKVDFTEGRMHNVRMVEGCVFDGSRFERADLSDANLRGTHLEDAQMREAKLARADLTRAHMVRADLRIIDAKGASFARAELTDARLTGANLMQASLASARLSGADLDHTNLSGTDLSRIRIDIRTRYASVLAIRPRLYPQHTPIDLRGPGGRGRSA